MGRTCKLRLTISIIIFCFTVTENRFTDNNHTFIVDPSFIRNGEKSELNVYIGATLEKFLSVENNLKTVILDNVNTYCHNKKMLSSESHISVNNVILSNCDVCPKNWQHSNECVQCTLSIQLQAENYMETSDLKTAWQDVQSSQPYKQIGLKSNETQTTSKTLIIVLSVVVCILLLTVIGLLYLLREKIKIFCINLCDKEDKTSEITLFTNSAFTNEEYDQSNKVVFSSNASDTKTMYFQNGAYIESNSSVSGNTTSTMAKSESTASTELVDDFDSDTEIEINFPSPLNCPPLPPRPIKKTIPTHGKQMHYMVSPIY